MQEQVVKFARQVETSGHKRNGRPMLCDSRGLVAKVPHSLARVLGATQEYGVGALGRAQRQLVECDALTASRKNAGTSGFGEPQGANCEQHTEEFEIESQGVSICDCSKHYF